MSEQNTPANETIHAAPVLTLGSQQAQAVQLENTAIAKRLQRGDEGISLLCFPAFLKLRWQAGGPTCAKVYLMVLGE